MAVDDENNEAKLKPSVCRIALYALLKENIQCMKQKKRDIIKENEALPNYTVFFITKRFRVDLRNIFFGSHILSSCYHKPDLFPLSFPALEYANYSPSGHHSNPVTQCHYLI